MALFTHKAYSVVAGAVDYVRVKAVGSTALTSTASTRDFVMDAICHTCEPFVVGDGYTVGSDSYLLFIVPAGSVVAATAQTVIRASGDAGLTNATVTVAGSLTGV